MNDIVKQPPSKTGRYSVWFVVVVLSLLLSFNLTLRPDLASRDGEFRWRKALIGFYTALRFQLGDRVFNQAIVGRDGWLFFTGEQSVDDYQGAAVLRPGKLARMQRNLDRLNSQLLEQGIHLLVVIAPNKSTIYPQYMPEGIAVTGQPSRLDQFIAYMQANGKTPILDLRPALLEASQTQQVYFKTDTHWNAQGAFLAYQRIMQVLSVHDPALAPQPLSAYREESVGMQMRDLPPLMGLRDLPEATEVLLPVQDARLEIVSTSLPDGRIIRTVTNTDRALPSLVVFGDSFYVSLAVFVEQHFSHTKSIPFTYEPGIWSLHWIEEERPDYVIVEITERVVDLSLPMLLEN